MKKYHGKDVDPESFKKMTPKSLNEKAKRRQKERENFKDMSDIDVTSCPVCDVKEGKRIIDQENYSFKKCKGCGHVYKEKVASEEKIIEFYEKSEEYADTYVNREQIEYRIENVTKPKIDFVLKHTDKETGSFLDIGCGIGTSLYYLKSEGWSVTGLEVSDDCIRTAKEILDVAIKKQTIDEYYQSREDKKFDVIVMFGYLDLVHNPLDDLKLASDMLVNDGVLAIHVPRHDSVAKMTQDIFPKQSFRHLSSWNIMHAFSLESTTKLFNRSGLSVESAWFYGLDFYEIINNMAMSMDDFYKSELYDYLLSNFNKFQKVIDEDEKSDYMTVVGKKV